MSEAPEAPREDRRAALIDAIKSGDVARARALLARHPRLGATLNEPAPALPFGTLPIHAAAERGSRELVDLLLGHGADVDARSRWWAGGFGVLELCDERFAPFLIERGATVGAHAAARLGMLDALAARVDADPAAVHARGGDGKTPLHYAATVAVADFLLDRGADIDALDVDHESTPAQWLVRERPDVARHLVRRGCRTDLLLAVALGDVELVRRHLDADPASVGVRVTDRHFPMRDRHAGGHIYTWTLGRNRSAPAIARQLGHGEIERLLLARSPDEARLAHACETGDDAAVAALLSARPDLARALPDDERRRLVDAATDNDAAAVRLMLAAGWPVDARGQHGGTALHWAAWHGNAAMVREILRHGPPLDARDAEHGGTPFGWALHGSENSWHRETGDHAATVEALLQAGVPAPAEPVEASAPVLEVLRRHAAGGA